MRPHAEGLFLALLLLRLARSSDEPGTAHLDESLICARDGSM
jgi:hypothetical protein